MRGGCLEPGWVHVDLNPRTSSFPAQPFWPAAGTGIGVGPRGLEPRTSSLSGKRSNRAELWAPDNLSDRMRSSATTAVRITRLRDSGEAEHSESEDHDRRGAVVGEQVEADRFVQSSGKVGVVDRQRETFDPVMSRFAAQRS